MKASPQSIENSPPPCLFLRGARPCGSFAPGERAGGRGEGVIGKKQNKIQTRQMHLKRFMQSKKKKFLHTKYTLFQKPGANMESGHCGQDKRIFHARSRLLELGVWFQKKNNRASAK